MSGTTTALSIPYTHDAAGRVAHPEYSRNLVSICGPITLEWTGRVDPRTERGIYAKSAPRWVVRYWTGPTRFDDRSFGSLEAAVEFAKTC